MSCKYCLEDATNPCKQCGGVLADELNALSLALSRYAQAAMAPEQQVRQRVPALQCSLDARDQMIREIVAWCEVAEQRYDLYDGTVVDAWPRDWLRRAKALLS